MIRRILTRVAAAAAALSVLPLLMTAAPAQAYGSCGVSVPSKVAITSPYREITARFSSGCDLYASYASWDVVHPTQGLEDILIYDGRSTDTMDWYDWSPLGTYTVRPNHAWDENFDDVVQNSPRMTVRLGSGLRVSHSRSGKYVTITAKSSRYSANARSYRSWAGATATLRFRNCTSCAWTRVRSTTTNRYGQATFKVSSSRERYWQVATSNTSSTWGTSRSFRR